MVGCQVASPIPCGARRWAVDVFILFLAEVGQVKFRQMRGREGGGGKLIETEKRP